MSHDIITLSPSDAGATLRVMQLELGDFNDKINSMGVVIQNTAAQTYSDPLLKALARAAHDLSQLQYGVNAALYAFAHAFVHVIEQWKKTDAQAAASISFHKPHFEPIRLLPHPARKLHVDTSEMKRCIDYLDSQNGPMRWVFESMDVTIKDSAHYWRGHSGDLTRQNWKRHLYPLMEKSVRTVNKVVDVMTEEMQALKRRDTSNFVGR